MDHPQLPEPDGGRPVRPASERIYRSLLRAYPAGFRSRFADEMVQLFSDQLRDQRGRGGSGGLVAVWIRALVDLTAGAIGEHLRSGRVVGESLATFESTPTMRRLGGLGVLGSLLLLFAFVTWTPFESLSVNTVRLVLFALSGAAISVAFYGRQAVAAPGLVLGITTAVVVAGVGYAGWTVVGLWVPSRFSGSFGSVGAVISLALWSTPTVYAAAMLRLGAAWREMTRWQARATKSGAVVLLGSALAAAGDDRWGLTRSEAFGPAWTTIALLGVGLCGAGWAILGVVLVLARGPAKRSV